MRKGWACAGAAIVLIGSLAPVLPATAVHSPIIAEEPVRPEAVTVLPSDYVIGPKDVLGILVWGEDALTLDVTVRPDGKVTLPLVNDVLATGLTPETLREHLRVLLAAYVLQPNVTVIVRQINSRTVSILGRVPKPGVYPLLTPLRALDLLALAGGLLASADARHLSILRTHDGERVSIDVDYTQVSRGIRPWQDVLLRPGDTLVVP